MDFGTRLKQVRKARKMTQIQLAELLGVEQSAISNYENGLRMPGASTVVQLSSHLGVTVDELLIGVNRDGVEETFPGGNPNSIIDLKSHFLKDVLEGRELSALQNIVGDTVTGAVMAEIIHELIEPALRLTGDLWEAGELQEAEEHLISERLANLLSTMGNLAQKEPPRPYTALFVLPGAEEHAMALRMAAELFSLRGWKTLFVGRSVPVSGLANVVKDKSVDLIVMSLTMKGHVNSAALLIRAVDSFRREGLPLVLVGGEAFSGDDNTRSDLGADFYAQTLKDLGEMIPLYEREIDSIRQTSKL